MRGALARRMDEDEQFENSPDDDDVDGDEPELLLWLLPLPAPLLLETGRYMELWRRLLVVWVLMPIIALLLHIPDWLRGLLLLLLLLPFDVEELVDAPVIPDVVSCCCCWWWWWARAVAWAWAAASTWWWWWDAAAAVVLNGDCHIVEMYGQLKELPESSMSRISVSIGVFPTRRTKNNCSIT